MALNVGGVNSKVREHGVGMVEYAIILPLRLSLIMGIIEFGRLTTTFAAVSCASREAARRGAAVGNDGLGTFARFKDCVGIRSAATLSKHVGCFVT